jgi:hypothetical protein
MVLFYGLYLSNGSSPSTRLSSARRWSTLFCNDSMCFAANWHSVSRSFNSLINWLCVIMFPCMIYYPNVDNTIPKNATQGKCLQSVIYWLNRIPTLTGRSSSFILTQRYRVTVPIILMYNTTYVRSSAPTACNGVSGPINVPFQYIQD